MQKKFSKFLYLGLSPYFFIRNSQKLPYLDQTTVTQKGTFFDVKSSIMKLSLPGMLSVMQNWKQEVKTSQTFSPKNFFFDKSWKKTIFRRQIERDTELQLEETIYPHLPPSESITHNQKIRPVYDKK